MGYIQLSFLQQAHISSLTRATGTKPNLHKGVQLLSVLLVINSIDKHQDSTL